MATKTQTKILAFIRRHIQKHGYPPSVREIQEYCQFKSPRAVAYHLEALEREGLIVRSRKARALKLTSEQAAVAVPIYASVPAGAPQLQEPARAELLANPSIIKGATSSHYALRVSGDSMIGARIFDGDIVIVDLREPKEGDIVVGLVDGENTLKRLIRKHGQYLLKAENPDFPEITPIEELSVQGVVVGVYRQL